QLHGEAYSQLGLVGNRAGCGVERALDGERRGYGTAGRLEHRQHRVADRVDDPAVMRRDVLTKGRVRALERARGPALVGLHQARIADGIRGEDRREALPRTVVGHGVWG